MFTKVFTITNLLLFFSIACILIATYTLYTSWQSTNWPSVTGKASLPSNHTKGSINSHKSPILTTTITEIYYSYAVSDRGSFFGIAPINKNTNFKSNDRVTVYYNPNNPKQSTLQPGPNWVYFIVFLILGCILAIGAYSWHKKVKALTNKDRS